MKRASRAGARRKSPPPRSRRAPDRIEEAFGPGAAAKDAPADEEAEPASEPPRGPIDGYACGGERCVFAPATALVTRFAAQLGPRHLRSLSHAATSGIELMKALRDFLDEEIAIAERASGKSRPGGRRYEKISVE